MALLQSTRIGQLTTPLGPNVLVLSRFEFTEGLSELFEGRIEALSEEPAINIDNLLGKKCTVTIMGNPKRHFNGVVVEANAVGLRDGHPAYNIVLRPWLWQLSRIAKCKIYKNQSVPDIIKAVFTDAGMTDVKPALSGSYKTLEYCVQYRETDLAFVSRLMEQWGIYYFFEHTSDKHTLVLADGKSAHHAIPGLANVPFNPGIDAVHRDEQFLSNWSSERRFRSGKFKLKDYDYEKPTNKLEVDREGNDKYGNKSPFVQYDSPHKYVEDSVGKLFVKVRLEAEAALDQRRHASGACPSIFPGGLFTLKDYPAPALGGIGAQENREYLAVRSAHSYHTSHYRSGPNTEAEDSYYGHYEVQPSDRPYRAPIVTPKALVDGPQTALVVNKQGKVDADEIDVDKEGRIYVRFHWQHEDYDKPDVIHRPVRVMQPWAYKQWGTQFIPRCGMEVVVIFEEGDPDFPLVIGSVYNGDNKVPYDLPANKTQSGVKSNSSPGGNGYNEFMFEDKKGSEKIVMHAEKDHEVEVLNKETWKIGKKFTPPMGSASRDAELINGDDKLKVSSGNQDIDIAQNIKIKAGMNIDIEAGVMIKLHVGGSNYIQIDPSGITINGTLVRIN